MKYITLTAALALYIAPYIFCGDISCIRSALRQHRGNLLNLVSHVESECGLCFDGPPILQGFDDPSLPVILKGNTFVKTNDTESFSFHSQ